MTIELCVNVIDKHDSSLLSPAAFANNISIIDPSLVAKTVTTWDIQFTAAWDNFSGVSPVPGSQAGCGGRSAAIQKETLGWNERISKVFIVREDH